MKLVMFRRHSCLRRATSRAWASCRARVRSCLAKSRCRTNRDDETARAELARGSGAGRRGPSERRAGVRGGAPRKEGWEGWDDYAPFYDWENARTLGRRDVPFWRRVALEADGPVLELGCGTGRISLPLVRAGVSLVGIDRSAPMLNRARRATGQTYQLTNSHNSPILVDLVRGDIRMLPFAPARLQHRHRAVRRPAVAAGRSRSRRGARLGGTGARAGRHLRTRSRARCAELARVFEPRAAARAGRARRPSHPHRVGSAGSRPPADDVRAALRGTAERPVYRAPVRADLSDVVGSADDGPARIGPGLSSIACSATIAAARGTRARMSGSSSRKRGRIFQILRSF